MNTCTWLRLFYGVLLDILQTAGLVTLDHIPCKPMQLFLQTLLCRKQGGFTELPWPQRVPRGSLETLFPYIACGKRYHRLTEFDYRMRSVKYFKTNPRNATIENVDVI